MHTNTINNHSDDYLIHVFSTGESRSIKNYKREKQVYKIRKFKKGIKADNKAEIVEEKAPTIDIRC